MHCFDNRVNRLDERLSDLAAAGLHHLGNPGNQIATLDFHRRDFGIDGCCADGHFDRLGRALSNQHIVFASNVIDDGFVHLVATRPNRLGSHDTRKRNDRHVSGSAADVNDHIARRGGDVQSGAYGRCHGLIDQIDLTRTCG